MSTNDLIIANLQVLLKQAQSSKDTKDRFRTRAYSNAIKAINNCEYQIKSGKDAQQLQGIGKSIADKIQEIIDTGKLHQVEELGSDQLEKTKVLTLFNGVWGIGPVKALELWDAGARKIIDLKTKKYQSLLTDNQKIGVKYYKDLLVRVPRWQVEEIVKKITVILRKINNNKKWKARMRVCGSYRRQSETCGDMDILLCENDGRLIMEELVKQMTKSGLLIENLGLGPTKYMGITRTSTGTAFRIDMEVIEPCEWPFALLYFTGSGQFNEKQRLKAKKMGYRLSEHGLKDTEIGSYVQGIKNERDIFEFLKMKYIAPHKRK